MSSSPVKSPPAQSWADMTNEEEGMETQPGLGPPPVFSTAKRPDTAAADTAASDNSETNTLGDAPAANLEEEKANGAATTNTLADAPAANLEEEKANGAAPAPSGGKDVDLGGLSLSTEEGTVDKPELRQKSEHLNEEVEAPDTEIQKITTEETLYTSAASFEELNLSPELLRGLHEEMGFKRPSRIQAETLPMILTPPFRDLIAQAHNGSGKTTCFGLGMLSRVDPRLREPQALCICPTRELAIQNEEVMGRMAKFSGITIACTAAAEASSATRREVVVDQVVVGTPGTLKKWITQFKILRTKSVKILVFDEADHMLDEDGFQDDSLRLIQNVKRGSPACQILLFSATFSERVKQFAARVVPSANQVLVPQEQLSLDVIQQYKVRCPDAQAKDEVLRERIMMLAEKAKATIIFVRTRENAKKLHSQLSAAGYACTAISGAMLHEVRDRVIKEFRAGVTKVLITTDVLARGFDHAQVNLVVNFDIPVNYNRATEPEYETYLHRIGRSGRFGRKGAAFNLMCSGADERLVSKIESHFEKQMSEVPFDNEEAFESAFQKAGLA